MNGGTCIDGVDDFTCSCPPGLTGLLCECLILDDTEEDTDANGDEDSATTRRSNLNCNYTRNDWTTTDQLDTETTTTMTMTTQSIAGNYETTTIEQGPTDNGEERITTQTATTPSGDTITSTSGTTNNDAYSTTTDAVGTTRTPAGGQTITTTTTINSTPITITTSDLDTTTTPSGIVEGHQVVTVSGRGTESTPASSAATSATTTPEVGDYGSESDKFTTILFPVETTSSQVDSMPQMTTTTTPLGAVTKDGQGVGEESSAIKTTTEGGQTQTTTTDATEAEEKTKVAITEPSIIGEQTTRQTKESSTTTDWVVSRTTMATLTTTGGETMPQTGYPHPEFFTDSPQLSSESTTTTSTTATVTTETPNTTTEKQQQTPPTFDGTITNFTLGLDCKRMPCLNGGTCIMASGGAQVSKVKYSCSKEVN